jgi:beta-glucosidase-like glycosyl hydrolase
VILKSILATRIIAAWYFLHQDAPSYPATNFDAFNPDNEATNEHIDVQDDHYKLVREIGAASTVLLKNERDALPLKKPRSIVLVGNDAGPGKAGPNQFPDQVNEKFCLFSHQGFSHRTLLGWERRHFGDGLGIRVFIFTFNSDA